MCSSKIAAPLTKAQHAQNRQTHTRMLLPVWNPGCICLLPPASQHASAPFVLPSQQPPSISRPHLKYWQPGTSCSVVARASCTRSVLVALSSSTAPVSMTCAQQQRWGDESTDINGVLPCGCVLASITCLSVGSTSSTSLTALRPLLLSVRGSLPQPSDTTQSTGS